MGGQNPVRNVSIGRATCFAALNQLTTGGPMHQRTVPHESLNRPNREGAINRDPQNKAARRDVWVTTCLHQTRIG